MADKNGAKRHGKASGEKDAEDRGRLIGELKDRNLVLEKELLNIKENLHFRMGELREKNHELEDQVRERELAERALRESEDRLRLTHQSLMEKSQYLEAFFNHTITPLVLLDLDFNFIRVNEAYARACQRGVDEFPGHNHFEFYPSDAKAIFEDVVRARQPVQVIARPFVFADHPEWGVTYWNWTLTPLLDDRGEVEALVFALEDVTGPKRNEIELEKHRDNLQELVRERTRNLQAANDHLRNERAERQRAEESVWENEKRYRSLFEHMMDGLAYCKMIFDNQGAPLDFVYLAVNDAFGRLTGLENVVGKRVTEVLPGIVRQHPELFEIYGRVALTGVPERFEINFKPLASWLSITVYSTERGYFTAIFENITGRKQAEEELAAAKDYLAADLTGMSRLQEISTRLVQQDNMGSLLGGIIEATIDITDADMGNIQLCKGKELKIVESRGFDKPFLDYFNSVHENEAVCGTAMVKGERVIVEDVTKSPIFVGKPSLEVMLAAGARAVQSTPLLSRSGRLMGMFSTYYRAPHRPEDRELFLLDMLARQASDLIERIRAEEALRNNERLYRAIGESIDYGVWVCAPDGRNIYASESFLKLVGMTQQQCSDFGWGDVLHPDDAERTIAAWRECVSTEGTWDIEHRYRGVDGEYHPILARGVPVRDEHGRIIYWAGINLDISNLKLKEEELKGAKMLAELYLDLMGHDINNMHQIALGYLEMARDMPPGEAQTVLLDKPAEVLRRSAQLIQNVRKLQRLRDGVFQTEVVDVTRVLVDVQWEFGAVPNKRVKLNLNGHGPCLIRANELLHEVFANLVSNAIKHTGDRTNIAVDLDVIEDNSGRYCRVAVEDDGPGIPNDLKITIFNRTLEGTNKARGMGLGLYLVKSLVDSYGGQVWAEDRVHYDRTQGARFVVMLPTIKME